MSHPLPQRLTPPDISGRAIAKLAGPIFVANIAIVGGGTIDTIMAGHLGADEKRRQNNFFFDVVTTKSFR